MSEKANIYIQKVESWQLDFFFFFCFSAGVFILPILYKRVFPEIEKKMGKEELGQVFSALDLPSRWQNPFL